MARKSRKNIEIMAAAPTREVQKPMFYAGAYIRLSVVDRKNKGDSIENQKAIINSFIAGQDDIELRECYVDNGYTGQLFDRPEFLRMIADMESGKINCCITKDLSRLGRNAIDAGYYIERHFPSLGVRYIAVTDDYDSADGQSGGIILSLKNMINETIALDTSRKVKATMQMNVRKGNFVGGTAPYGYFKSDGDCHKLVIDECTAPVVLRMFEMAAEGQTHRAILNWLNASGNLPPMRYLHSIGLATDKEVGVDTKWWGMRAVKDMLRNRMYCGDMVQGKHKVVATGVNTRVPKSEWVIVEDTHEAIVSRELFDMVQQAFAEPDTAKEPYYKSPKTENVFARKLFCSHCGYAMIRKRGSEKSYGFKCNTQLLYSADACVGARMTETALKSEVLRLIHEYEPYLEKALSTPNAASETDNSQMELNSAQSELGRNKRFLEGLYESLVSGDISDTEYKDMKSAYEVKVSALAENIKHLRETISQRTRQEAALSQARTNIKRLEQISDLTAEIVDRLVERITVCSDGRIAVKFSFLDETVYNKEGGAEDE